MDHKYQLPSAALIRSTIAAILLGMSCISFAMERVTLLVGEIHPVPAHEAEITWHLSRRGVIELSQDQNGVWIMVALRGGVVIAKAISSHGRVVAQYMVQVQKAEHKRSQLGLLERHDWQNWICQLAEIHCDRSALALQGQVHEFELFFQLQHLCRKYQPCLFRLKLSTQGQQDLARILTEYPGVHEVTVNAEARVKLEVDCGLWPKTRQNELAKSLMLSKSNLIWACSEIPGTLQLDIKAVMLDQQLLKRIQPQALVKQMSWQKFLESHADFLQDQTKNRLIGEPSVQISLGQTIEIHHGLEIPVISSSDKPREYWRRLGFVMKGQLKSRQRDQVQLQLEFSLSQPGRDRQLTSSQLNTTVWLKIGEEHIIGTLDSSTSLFQEQQHIFLAFIPIIGPLFRARQSSQGQAQVLLLVKIQEASAKEWQLDLE